MTPTMTAFRQAGFTFMELLVVMSIVMLVSATGLVSYRAFIQEQNLVQSGKQLFTALQVAQGKIAAGDKPNGCGTQTLTAYGVRGVGGASTVSVRAHCGTSTLNMGNYQLSDGVSVQSTFEVRFLGLYGGIDNGNPVNANLVHSNGKVYQVTISPGGAIHDRGVQ